MKISLFLGLTALLTGTDMVAAQNKETNPVVPSTQEIMFTGGKWKEVTARAKKTGRYIFVDAYTNWCAPCRQLKNVTFRNRDAAAYFNENFINYTIDMEKGEGIQLAEKWEVFSYPTLLFFTAEGKMVMKQVGYVDGTRLVELGKQALAGNNGAEAK